MTTVLLAEDHTLVRSGIRSMLEGQRGMSVVGECGDGREAVRLFQKLKPHLVLMDVAMPNLNGIEATRKIIALHPAARVIMLSMHADGQYLFESLRAGAAGYVLKDAAFGELLAAIRQVGEGQRYLSPAVADLATADLGRSPRRDSSGAAAEVLSAREREVLHLIGEGNSSAEIARKLAISVRTVETHRQHIMEKLSIHSIAGLTKFAIRNGMCSL